MIEKIDKNDKTRGLSTYAIIDKVNEIVDFLNGTYLMKVKDGQNVIVDGCVNDRIDTFLTGLSVSNDGSLYNAIDGPALTGGATCPHCGKSYYTEMYSASTAVYYPPVYKDGVNINPDMNKSTTHCRCLSCNKEFDI